MGRLYTASFEDVSVAAAQDLISLLATPNMALRIHRIVLGQRSLTTWEAKPIRLRRFPVTVTVGSGGSAPTPRTIEPSDAAATATARANDTTAMTSSGTALTIHTRMFEFLNGVDWVLMPRETILIRPSEGFALNLPTAPSGATNMSASVTFEEMF